MNSTIEAHVARCGECRTLVASLASPPPVPLATQIDPPPERAQAGPWRTPARALPLSNTWLPFLLAAGLAGLALLPPFFRGLEGPTATLPAHPLYRGFESSALLFPRGKLLAGAGAPEYELRPVEGASTYRVEVYARGASAFDEGRRVQVLYSNTPRPSLIHI